MRVELRNLQRELGLMFIHVTHNQEESLSMADRIVVMNDAKIQQIGDPLTVATKPRPSSSPGSWATTTSSRVRSRGARATVS